MNAPAAMAKAPVIMVLGDSISAGYGLDPGQGWVTLLARRLKTRDLPFEVINSSISGDTTAGGRARLPAALQRYQPVIVIVELGGNDGLRGLSLSAMRANLDAIIGQVRCSGAHVLLVGMRLPPNYGPGYTKAFHDVYLQLAAQRRVALVPFLLVGVATQRSLMQNDGIHPRANAQPQLLDNLWPQLKTLLKTAKPGS